MIITISMIVNNYEWIVNNQIAMDIIKLLGFQLQFNDAYKEIRKITKSDNNTYQILSDEDITMEYIIVRKNKILTEYRGIFDLFYELNSRQKNKNTYLPNLYGLLLISNTK